MTITLVTETSLEVKEYKDWPPRCRENFRKGCEQEGKHRIQSAINMNVVKEIWWEEGEWECFDSYETLEIRARLILK